MAFRVLHVSFPFISVRLMDDMMLQIYKKNATTIVFLHRKAEKPVLFHFFSLFYASAAANRQVVAGSVGCDMTAARRLQSLIL